MGDATRTNRQAWFRRVWKFALALSVVGLVGPAGAEPAQPFPGPGQYSHDQIIFQGSAYPYALYVPRSVKATEHPPLLVMIHGCHTTPDQQAHANQYHSIAERNHFLVLYPDNAEEDRNTTQCWKGLFAPQLESRGTGSAAAIATMTQAVARQKRVDPSRVYAVGMSSGGFETSILAAEYPDIYAAVGIHSGAGYARGATGCAGGAKAYVPTDNAAAAQAALATEGPRARVVPTIFFHGDEDPLVAYPCGRDALQQWLQTNNSVLAAGHADTVSSKPAKATQGRILGGPASTDPISAAIDGPIPGGGYAYTVETYAQPGGCTIAEFWTMHGMGHYWSGGTNDPPYAGTFNDPNGPSAAAASWAFFANHHLTAPGAASPCTAAAPRRVPALAPPTGSSNGTKADAAPQSTKAHVEGERGALASTGSEPLVPFLGFVGVVGALLVRRRARVTSR